jgi:uncharacterized membrane protein
MISNTSELELPRGLLEEAPWHVRARREVVRFLPAWMFFFYGCLLLNTSLTNFDPPRPDLAANAIFPIGVFVVFYVVRALKAPDVENRWGLLLLALSLAFFFPVLNLAYHRPSPVSGRGLLVAFELSNFVWASIMGWHAWRSRRGHGLLFFGAGFLYGLCLENGGIMLGFFHETNLELTVVKPFVAPGATMIGWCVVLYMATFVVWQLRKWVPQLRAQNALSAVLVAAMATLLDLQIDPLATASGAWVWDSMLPGWFHGVPQVNFVAWMCALAPFAYVMFRAQDRHTIADGGLWTRRALRDIALAVPGTLVIAALAFLISTALLEGISGPSWTILNRFSANLLAAVFGL